MKAGIAFGKGKLKVCEVQMPEPGPYQCLCKMLACATCTGTDRAVVDGKLIWNQKYPGILGHESVGRVIKAGAKARNIKEGEIFLRPTACYPGEKLGDYCSLLGGFAEYGLITDTKAFYEDNPDEKLNGYTIYQQKIPAEISISPADATMLITLKETSSFAANSKITINSSVMILGCGTVGMSMCNFAKIFGAYPVIIVGRRDNALEQAKKAYPDFTINNKKENMAARVREITGGKGVDFVFDAAGDPDLVSESFQLLSKDGRVVPYAVASPELRAVFDRKKELVLSAGPAENLAHRYLLDCVKLNLINLKSFYSHRMPLDKIEEGFDLIRKGEAYKIVFEM
jgi:threonine dehydrogenase-like Zn-dependent dehydrogenase